jgi:methyl-accepting chemotaxis protein
MSESVLARLFRLGPGERSTGKEGATSTSQVELQREAIERRYELRADRVAERCGDAELAALSQPHLTAPFEASRDLVREQARAYRDHGFESTRFVDGYGVAIETAVTAAFDELRANCDADEETLATTETALTGVLDDILGSMAAGVSTFDGPRAAADGGRDSGSGTPTPTADESPPAEARSDRVHVEETLESATPTGALGPANGEFPLGYEAILDHIGTCLFVLDTDGDIVFWNRGAEQLTGEDREDAYGYELSSQAFYHDGRRAKTLADKVLDAPESADREYGVPRAEDVDYTLYRDRSTMTDATGAEINISFSAAPLYDDDGDLVGVVEMVQDRTDDVQLREETASLLTELQDTIESLHAGDYSARSEFESDILDDEMLSVVDTLNELAEQFQTLSAEIQDEMDALCSTSEDVTDAATDITEAADDQDQTMKQLSTEISNLSATVEEVASSATQVDQTSSRAEEMAIEGQESAEEAVSLMHDVEDSADDVAEDVDALQSRIEEIDEIATVINDIADQTNILALNASIEAARAGEAGEGFAVVADEVKQLAEESQQHATEIEALIEDIQADTEETVTNLTETTDSIDAGIDQVEESMERLSGIVDAISEASDGIQEVADATDDQAASTEEIASMIDEAATQADEIAADIEEIAADNEDQMDRAADLRETVQDYMN